MSQNGRLSKSELRRIYYPGQKVYLEKRAAASFNTLRIWSKKWMKVELHPTGTRSAYRSYEEQVYFWNLYVSGKGALAARPGTSNHGWGKAIDLPTYTMQQIVKRFGKNVKWSKTEAFSEPWHYNYTGGYNRPNPGLSVAYPVARRGSGGWGQKWYVKKIQRRLRKLGYKAVKVDGDFGKVTEEKVKHFQRITGLKNDGVVRKATWIKLWKITPKRKKQLHKADLKKKDVKEKNKPTSKFGISEKGIDFIKSWEGYTSNLVDIGDGVHTIGYGYTQPLNSLQRTWVPNQKEVGKLTQEEARELLAMSLKNKYEPAVIKLFESGGYLEGMYEQHLYDALVSFAYNLGAGAFTATKGFESIQRGIKNRDVEEIANSLIKYVSPGTIFEEGLKRRRGAERILILNKVYKNNK